MPKKPAAGYAGTEVLSMEIKLSNLTKGGIMANAKISMGIKRFGVSEIHLSPRIKRLVAHETEPVIIVMRDDSDRIVLEKTVYEIDNRTGKISEWPRDRVA